MTGYVIEQDIQHFFPGAWDKMTEEEKESWRKKWRALKARCRSNTQVTKNFAAIFEPGNTRNRSKGEPPKAPQNTGGQPPTVEWE